MSVAAAQTVIAWQAHEGPRIARVKGYDIIHCLLCGFRHVVPLPEPGELARAHREAAFAENKAPLPEQSADDQVWAELARTDRLEVFEKLLGPQRHRLLDIGSGSGFFLKTAKARGWQVLGIEPSHQAAAHARSLGVEVAEGFFNATTAPGLGRFDAVNLNNVLEYVPNPTTLLILARDLLAPGGALCVNVPNDFSPFQIAASAAAGMKEWWIAPPHHLNYFDFETLGGLLERLDLFIAERTTSFPMEAFVMMGENYTNDPALGRVCHGKRRKFDLSLEMAGLKETRRAFYRALAEAGIGREAVIVAIKP